MWIGAVVRCAPPGDKPTPEEIRNCASHLADEIAAAAQGQSGRLPRQGRLGRLSRAPRPRGRHRAPGCLSSSATGPSTSSPTASRFSAAIIHRFAIRIPAGSIAPCFSASSCAPENSPACDVTALLCPTSRTPARIQAKQCSYGGYACVRAHFGLRLGWELWSAARPRFCVRHNPAQLTRRKLRRSVGGSQRQSAGRRRLPQGTGGTPHQGGAEAYQHQQGAARQRRRHRDRLHEDCEQSGRQDDVTSLRD